jgi:hypothetical protein
MDDATGAAADTAAKTSIKFNYIKSAQFRVVHADGAYGGVTPRGYIHASLYSERRPLPQVTEVSILPGDQLGEEKPVFQKDDIVRELEVGLVMDLAAAKAFHDWLGKKIQTVEEIFVGKTEAE